tara:strand:- start:166 stop:456 length:291 start_codon:yes stop_codon:yes gene_type:complete
MTEKKQSRDMGVGPSTKKLKSMLKILSEHGVSRYKDSEFEIELSVGFDQVVQSEKPESFSFGNYDANLNDEDKKSLEARDSLGYTEEDYLWRSAET